MGIKDLIVTPIYLILFVTLALWIRPFLSTPHTRLFFLPALSAKFLGALALGLIYQFHYGGGDTFNFWTHGSRWIWEAFQDNPLIAFKMLFDGGGTLNASTLEYSQHIWYYRSPSSYFIVRLASFFDFFTFHTYSSTALFFALFSFSGSWALFSLLCKEYPYATKYLAVGILFLPSIVLWGSGILKDTITFGAFCWLIWSVYSLIELRKKNLSIWLVLIISGYLIVKIKLYIMVGLLPAFLVWRLYSYAIKARKFVNKIVLLPTITLILGVLGFGLSQWLTDESSLWKIDNIAERAAITAYDIRFGWGARLGGDGGYYLGELDGTWESMMRLFPSAVNVSLFRPYLWEARNPFMLLAALEGFVLLILSISFLLKRSRRKVITRDAFLMFCLVFTIFFAFAIGVSTSNFGTLIRYKIPMLLTIGILLSISKDKQQSVGEKLLRES